MEKGKNLSPLFLPVTRRKPLSPITNHMCALLRTSFCSSPSAKEVMAWCRSAFCHATQTGYRQWWLTVHLCGDTFWRKICTKIVHINWNSKKINSCTGNLSDQYYPKLICDNLALPSSDASRQPSFCNNQAASLLPSLLLSGAPNVIMVSRSVRSFFCPNVSLRPDTLPATPLFFSATVNAR